MVQPPCGLARARLLNANGIALDIAQQAWTTGSDAVLSVSGKDGNLLDMWGGPGARFDRSAAIITKDNASLLKRLLAKGVVPKVEMEFTGGFGSHPVQAYDVVADLPGTHQGRAARQ
jgi:hypothetical protein